LVPPAASGDRATKQPLHPGDCLDDEGWNEDLSMAFEFWN